MGDPIERPFFADGETLEADDLNATVDVARARDARHARQAHRWGIISGLSFSGADTPAGFEVTLGTGTARDIRGRELVVSEPRVLSPDAFNVGGGGDTDWYPVFIIGVESDSTGSQALGRCSANPGVRRREDVEIEFGRPQEAINWEDQPVAEVEVGPDTPSGQSAARVLVGFVQWNTNQGTFTAAKEFSPTVRRRGAGARGGAFESIDGSVLGRFGDAENEAFALVVDGKPPLLSVDRKGNLTIQGTLSSALKSDVKVSSGIATDGTKLPLPDGVAEADVGTRVTVHVFLRPLVTEVPSLPTECRVDEFRRVRCVAWSLKAPTAGTATWDAPAEARVEYLLIAAPKGPS
jgi:hypothetical protein